MSFLRKKIIYLSLKQLVLFLIVAVSFAACKKDADNVLDTPPPADDLSKAKLALLDTMREIYYWNERVPAASQVNVRNYASVLATLDAFRHPSDRFSTVADLVEITNVFSGTPKDYGIGSLRADAGGNIRIGYVYRDSPLGREGVTRGCILQKIGGKLLQTNDAINAEMNKAQNSFEVKFLDGSVRVIEAAQASYKTNPVILKSIISDGDKKIAYLVYNSFLGDNNEQITALSSIFGEFKQAKVNDIILDLRYNGGGYVSIHNHLVNLLAPLSANGKLLSQRKFNATIQKQYGQQILQGEPRIASQPNSLNLNRVIIITTKNSASASEQLINNLKPYTNVVTIGSTTYGKPAFNNLFGYKPFGFYLTIGVIANANGEGDFFSGIPATIMASDDVSKDFGNTEETSLKQALQYIRTGSLTSNGRVEAESQPAIIGIENIKTWTIDNRSFK